LTEKCERAGTVMGDWQPYLWHQV